MRVSNPFYNVGPINDPDLFFNRQTSIETLLDGLFAEKPMCRSIVGQRKIGKSSFARHLGRNSTIEKYYSAENRINIHISCQTDRAMLSSKRSFFEVMFETLFAELPDEIANKIDMKVNHINDSRPWRKWSVALRELWKEHIFVTLYFDEFDLAIAQKALIEEGLFGSLRGYANDSPNFAWVTCTNKHLHVLFKQSFEEFKISELVQKSESDFFNIAPAHVLGLFEPEEILDMITIPAKSKGIDFSEEIVSSIVQFGGRFPYFIQRGCFHFFNSIATGSKKDSDLLVQECVREAKDLWQAYWNSLDARQQKLLLATARQEPITAYSVEREDLLSTSLVYQDLQGDLHLFSKEFSQFVINNGPPHPFYIIKGQWLDDRYEVRDLLWVTAHSQIAKSWDRRWKRDVAIKFIKTDHEADPATILLREKRLFREAKLLSELSHPNIGNIYDVLLDPLGIVMEWIDGFSLMELIHNGKAVSTSQAIEIGLELADALQYVHSQGRIHCDVKPSNIIQTLDGSHKLIDFDIARSSGLPTSRMHKDRTSYYVGTSEYSSPEKLRGEILEPPADLFSLGVLLYQLLTLELPYKNGNNPSQYLDGVLPKPKRLTIPDNLYQILCLLLEESPHQRLDAQDLQKELQRCPDWNEEGNINDQFSPNSQKFSSQKLRNTDSHDSLKPGDIVGDNYEIIKYIKQGSRSNSFVFTALDHAVDSRVVFIKEPAFFRRRDYLDDVTFQRLFNQYQREVKILARIQHSYIAQVYNFVDQRYMVQEWVKGESLRSKITEGISLSFYEIKKISKEACQALGHVYETAGIIHRDIKPEHIFIAEDGHIRIIDFGLARTEDRRLLSLSSVSVGNQSICGTPAYMPPEQALGEEDHRADIFAFGMTLYELLTFKRAYPLRPLQNMFFTGEIIPPPVPLRTYRPDLPEQFEGCIMKAIRIAVGDRYRRWEDFESAISNVELPSSD